MGTIGKSFVIGGYGGGVIRSHFSRGMRDWRRPAASAKLDRSRFARDSLDSVKHDFIHCQSQQYLASMLAEVSEALSVS